MRRTNADPFERQIVQRVLAFISYHELGMELKTDGGAGWALEGHSDRRSFSWCDRCRCAGDELVAAIGGERRRWRRFGAVPCCVDGYPFPEVAWIVCVAAEPVPQF